MTFKSLLEKRQSIFTQMDFNDHFIRNFTLILITWNKHIHKWWFCYLFFVCSLSSIDEQFISCYVLMCVFVDMSTRFIAHYVCMHSWCVFYFFFYFADEPTINQTNCNVVDGIDLDEIKEFAKAFKLRRLSLGLTQTQVGQALSVTEGPAYSQSAICRLVIGYYHFHCCFVFFLNLVSQSFHLSWVSQQEW